MGIKLGIMASMIAVGGFAAALQAQDLPTTQPNHVSIGIEDLKVGVEGDHSRNEAGWPAALQEAESPYYYLALESMTGPSQAWYVSSFESFAQEGESMKMFDANPALAEELDRLWKADAQYLDDFRQIQAVARPDLSFGNFPDIGTQRFWEITDIRARFGQEQALEAAMKMFGEAATTATPNRGFRVYQVITGVNGSHYLIFTSVAEYSEFDQVMADGNTAFASLSEDQREEMNELFGSAVQSATNNRYRLNPRSSYVPTATRAADPAFWNPGR